MSITIVHHFSGEEKKKKEKSFSDKFVSDCADVFVGLCFLALMGLACGIQLSERETKRLKRKLMFFNPTIHEGIFGKYTSWTLREKPLSEEEVEILWNQKM
jgi:hypothetical protein